MDKFASRTGVSPSLHVHLVFRGSISSDTVYLRQAITAIPYIEALSSNYVGAGTLGGW